jgi:hypothetical protein
MFVNGTGNWNFGLMICGFWPVLAGSGFDAIESWHMDHVQR